LDGSDGLTALVNTTDLLVGDSTCPEGGLKVESGLDANGSGELDIPDELQSTSYICNGVDGSNGSPGSDGLDGSDGLKALVNTTDLNVGDTNCANGGTKLEYGIDDNGNDILDTVPDEIDGTSYICNGTDGASGSALLTASAVSSSQIDLDWSGMSGNPAVLYWDIYLENMLLDYAASTTTTYSVTGLMPNTMYCYTVLGLDSSYNTLAESNEACAATVLHDTWGYITNTSAPAARAGHTAVWTGSKMIVWGGSPTTQTGGVYDPATDTWTPTITASAPTPRYAHTAVWTGSKMLIWGGADSGGNYLATGGAYDPDTDTWSVINTTGAPDVRHEHTAVWTGTKMLVWGGYGTGGTLDTGSAYDPDTDTWTSLSTTNAPWERWYHTAVWTGSEMIIWGGKTDSGSLIPASFARAYDPGTDTWTAISDTGAPDTRANHTAVWTGSKMLIWGGVGGMVWNDGGAYDPVTDTWTLIEGEYTFPSDPLAPAARYDHTAVWTGLRMIVWGGFMEPSTYYDDGKVYNPATDKWTTITATDAQTGRSNHTAVWTGYEMLLWGGTDGTNLAIGGAYTP
jgi:N-acetylneuraminic acid mutarotase